jgi:hypothetical protein
MFQDFPKYGVAHKFSVALKIGGKTIVGNLSQIVLVISVSVSSESAETDVDFPMFYRLPRLHPASQNRFKKVLVTRISAISHG